MSVSILLWVGNAVSLGGSRRFEGSYCLYLLSQAVQEEQPLGKIGYIAQAWCRVQGQCGWRVDEHCSNMYWVGPLCTG
jgi:hypothetical protein